MRLPTAPASSRAKEIRPKGWRKKPRTSAISSRTDITREIRVSSQVCSENREKAAPVFCT